MIKFMGIAALLICSLSLFGQTPDSAALRQRQKNDLDIFRLALGYNDLPTAAHALTTYLYYGGSKAYEDTLALVYFQMNNLTGAYRLAGEIYAGAKNNITAVSILAEASSRAGETKTSLDWYEKLCVLKPEPYNFYQLAAKQFVLERQLECRQNLGRVIADSAAAGKVNVSLDMGNGYSETVPVVAAAFNMLAAMAYKNKQAEEAKGYYRQALLVFPGFKIAKQNLDNLSKPAAGSPFKTGAKRLGPGN